MRDDVMSKRLVIFDMDGTILNTLSDLAAAMNAALRQSGYPTYAEADYRFKVGNGVDKLVERSLPSELARDPQARRQLKQIYLEHYARLAQDKTAPYDGIPELLEQLRRRNILSAVATNKPHEAAVAVARHYFGPDTFACVYGQGEGRPVKPDPALVQAIFNHVRIPAEETLYVGDSGVDMETAARCGLESVGVLWGFRPEAELRAAGARHLVAHPSEILSLL